MTKKKQKQRKKIIIIIIIVIVVVVIVIVIIITIALGQPCIKQMCQPARPGPRPAVAWATLAHVSRVVPSTSTV